MRVKVSKVKHSTFKNNIQITRIWANDGWCYIPELQLRQKFLVVDTPSEFELLSEPWQGIIPKPEHWEQLNYYPKSQFPLVWEEMGPWGREKYEESIQSTNRSVHLPPRRGPSLG